MLKDHPPDELEASQGRAPGSNGAGPGTPVLSVIVPTYNERETIAPLIGYVLEVLGETPAEVVVVDDASPDGTGAVVETLGRDDSRVRLLSRPSKRGLASAVFDGAAQAHGEYVCVMDADMSHDPEELPGMLAAAGAGADVVVGSRYVPGGSVVDWPLGRRLVSTAANVGARTLLMLRAHDVLSGFVVCRRALLAEMPTHYSAGGFKFLVELLATRRDLQVAEVPITFRDRKNGRSKASAREGLELGVLCLRLLAWQVWRAVIRR